MCSSGEDALTFAMMALGGDGGIMAVANVIGKEYYQMIHLMLAGKIAEAREIHYKTLPVVRALFIESNPATGQRSHEHDGRTSREIAAAAGPS